MRQFIKDNLEEWLIGFILGLGFFWAIGWWAVLLGIITGVAYRAGGSGWLKTKAWRRIGISVMLFLTITELSWFVRTVASLSTFGLLTVGYGSRSTQPPDPGSPLGNFWLNTLKNENGAKLASRATIIIAIWITFGVAYGLATK